MNQTSYKEMKSEERLLVSKENWVRLGVGDAELAVNAGVDFKVQTQSSNCAQFKHSSAKTMINKCWDFQSWLGWSRGKEYKGFSKKMNRVYKFKGKVRRSIRKSQSKGLKGFKSKNPFSDEEDEESGESCDYEETKRRFIKNLGFKNKVKRKLRQLSDTQSQNNCKLPDLIGFSKLFESANMQFKSKDLLGSKTNCSESRESKLMFNYLKDLNHPKVYDEHFYRKRKEVVQIGNKRHGVFDNDMILYTSRPGSVNHFQMLQYSKYSITLSEQFSDLR